MALPGLGNVSGAGGGHKLDVNATSGAQGGTVSGGNKTFSFDGPTINRTPQWVTWAALGVGAFLLIKGVK